MDLGIVRCIPRHVRYQGYEQAGKRSPHAVPGFKPRLSDARNRNSDVLHKGSLNFVLKQPFLVEVTVRLELHTFPICPNRAQTVTVMGVSGA